MRKEVWNIDILKKIKCSFEIIPKTIALLYDLDKITLLFIVFFSLIIGFLPTISIVVFQAFINELTSNRSSHIIFLFSIYILINMLQDVVIALNDYLNKKFQAIMDYKLVNNVMRKCSSLSLRHFEDAQINNLIQHVQTQVSYRPYQILMNIINLITSLATCIFSIIIFAKWSLFGVIFIFIPTFVSSIYFLCLCDKEFMTEEKRVARSRNSWYLEYLLTKDLTFKEVKLFSLGNYILKRHKEIKMISADENLQLAVKRKNATIFFNMVEEICFAIISITIVVSMIDGKILIGTVMGLLRIIALIHSSFSSVMKSMYDLYQNSLYMRKLFMFFDIKVDKEKYDNVKIESINNIKVNGLSFSYPQSEKLVLDNLNFEIKKGERIALFGSNGSGKTTLVKLILGFYKATDRTILFNDICINSIQLDSIYKVTGAIFQDFTKYELTLRENVGFGQITNIKDDKKIKMALKNADINFLDNNNLEQQLGLWFDDGIQLSGGQWQKIALTRAFFNDADLYLLDEPSSALDIMAEKNMMKRFMKLTEGKMALFITHKIANAMMADKIIFIDKGKIVDMGTHDELLVSCDSYRKIYEMEMS